MGTGRSQRDLIERSDVVGAGAAAASLNFGLDLHGALLVDVDGKKQLEG